MKSICITEESFITIIHVLSTLVFVFLSTVGLLSANKDLLFDSSELKTSSSIFTKSEISPPDIIGGILNIIVQPLPPAKIYGNPHLLGEDLVNGELGGYKIGQYWESTLSTYSFKRKDIDWYVNGVKIFGCKSKVCGIVVYYSDSPEEDYLIYVWERLKEKFGDGVRIEYKGFEIDMWVTDRYLIGMGFYNEPKYFLFVVDKNRIKYFDLTKGIK